MLSLNDWSPVICVEHVGRERLFDPVSVLLFFLLASLLSPLDLFRLLLVVFIRVLTQVLFFALTLLSFFIFVLCSLQAFYLRAVQGMLP